MIDFKYSLYFLLFSIGLGQFFHSPNDLGTSGANFTGHLGTHVLQTNPAILGIKSGDQSAVIPVDTFSVLYRVRLVESEDKNEIKNIEAKLKRDGIDRKYEITKLDSIFVLDAPGFEDSFSAHNFSRNLPATLSDFQILTDTTRETYYKQKYGFQIQLYATDVKDSLKSFIKRSKPFLKGLKRNVSLIDSMYRFSVGEFNYEQEALIIKDSLIDLGLSPDAFVVKEQLKSSSLVSPKFSMTFPINYSFNLSNNLFNANWFNTYSNADMIAQPELKENLLNSVPSKGLDGRFLLNSSIFDFTYKNFGVSLLNTNIFSSVTFPKALFNMIFEGVKFEEPVDISDFNFSSYFVNSSSISYGLPIEHETIPFESYLGFGLRFLSGNFAYMDSFSGQLITNIDSITVFYDQKTVMPDMNNFSLANGFGIDLGVYCNIDERISGQISFIGLGSSLKANIEVQHLIQEITVSNDDINGFDFSDSTKDSWVVLDTSFNEDVKVDLPARMNLGLNYIFSNEIHFKGSVQHLMQTKFIGSVSPRLSIGAEFFPKTRTPLWTGFSFGGLEESFSMGLGFGVHLGAFHFNFGFNQLGGVFNEAKGISFATETRLAF